MAGSAYSHTNVPKLEAVLNDEVLCGYYSLSLEHSLSLETLLFYRATQEYQKLPTQEQRKVRLLEIVNQFLVYGSENEIDISGERRKELQEALAEAKADALDGLQWDTFDVMSRDCLPRFIRSQQYTDYLANRVDSPKAQRSRKKLEEFFGEEILGPLYKQELVKVIKRRAAERSQRKRRWLTREYMGFRLGFANETRDKLKEKFLKESEKSLQRNSAANLNKHSSSNPNITRTPPISRANY